MSQIIKRLCLLLLTEQCWHDSMNQLWFTLSQYSFVHNLLYLSLILNDAECPPFSWPTGCWCERCSEQLCTTLEINLSCLLSGLRCCVQNLYSEGFFNLRCLTLIRSMFPARPVFCYYLNFRDRWITGGKGKRQRKPKEMKMPLQKTEEGLDRESIISHFLFLLPREDT